MRLVIVFATSKYSSMDSSPGVRSQISVEDVQVGEPTSSNDEHQTEPLSPHRIQFLTQIPLSQNTARATSQNNSTAQEMIRPRDKSNFLLPEDGVTVSTAQILAYALSNKAEVPTSNVLHKSNTYGKHEINAASPHFDGKITASANSQISSAQDENLVQMQLVAPATSHIGYANISKNAEDREYQSDRGSHTTTSMALNLATRFGVETSHEGRISERMVRIPKNQMKLLSTGDHWYPALVGTPNKPGNLPLDILNSLTETADGRKTISNVDAIAPTTMNGDTASVGNSDADEIGSSAAHSPASSTVSEGHWPPSPPSSRRNQLPPDSSPIRTPKDSTHIHSMKIINQKISSMESSPGNSMPGDMVVTVARQLTPNHSVRSASQQASAFETADANIVIREGNQYSQEDVRSLPSVSVRRKFNRGSDSVQVNQTPFNPKSGTDSNSLYSSTCLVHSTFDETTDYRTQDRSLRQAIPRQDRRDMRNLENFEDNSSEDEAERRNNRQIKGANSAISGNGISLQSQPRDISEAQQQTSSTSRFKHQTQRKRDYSTWQGSNHSPSKRSKGLSQEGENRTDYRALDVQRRRDRREFYKSLKGNHATSPDPKGSIESPQIKTAIARNIESSDHSSKHSTTRVLANLDRPARTLSTINASDYLGQKSVVTSRMSTQHANDLRSGDKLYARFLQAYPTYAGNKMHFDAACQLLKTMQEQISLHISLWDAFVFRHYEYRFYLLEVVETCGTALSYLDFFNKIEEPGCHHRVLPSSTVSLARSPADTLRCFSASESSMQRLVAKSNSEQDIIETAYTGHEDAEVESQSINQSVSPNEASSQSVKAWLDQAHFERAAGAESSILGSSENLRSEKNTRPHPKNDVMSDTEDLSAIETVQHNNNSTGVEASKSSSVHMKKQSGTTIQLNPHSVGTDRKLEASGTSADTIFERFTYDYQNLPSERAMMLDTDLHNVINIFGWRR